MNITSKKIGANQLKIYVTGKINIVTSETFHNEVDRISTGFGNIVFDFCGVTYISSAGLREILIYRKKFFTMRIENVQREVYSIFQLAGFTYIIDIVRADETPDETKNIRVAFKKFLRDKAIYSSDEIAVDFDGEKYTWRMVSRCATIIAADLSDLNVKQGDRVAICGANSINWVLTFFAIQKLGAIAVLVDFNLDAKEIVDLCASSDVTHFCFGEIPAPIDDVKNLCDKVKFYSIQSDKNFRTRLTEYRQVKHKIYQMVSADDPAIIIFTPDNRNGLTLSAVDVLSKASVKSVDKNSCVTLPFSVADGLTKIFANALTDTTIFIPKNS